jgi:hypothetical protein
VGALTTVENDPDWYEAVRNLLVGMPHATVHLFGESFDADIAGAVPVSGFGAHTDAPDKGDQVSPKYLAFLHSLPLRSFDLILNDGWARHYVGLKAVDLVKPGGLLVWDDTSPRELSASPTREVQVFIEATSDWRKVSWHDGVHRTTCFLSPP